MSWNFFVQNSGLPLWKIAIFGLKKKSHFYGLKRFPLYLGHQETLFESFFWQKNKQTKILDIFDQIVG